MLNECNIHSNAQQKCCALLWEAHWSQNETGASPFPFTTTSVWCVRLWFYTQCFIGFPSWSPAGVSVWSSPEKITGITPQQIIHSPGLYQHSHRSRARRPTTESWARSSKAHGSRDSVGSSQFWPCLGHLCKPSDFTNPSYPFINHGVHYS